MASTDLQTIPSASHMRAAFASLISGLLAALITAILARGLMRIVALVTTGRGSFSIEGTGMIIFFGALLGPLFGMAFGTLYDRLPGKSLVKGLVYAVLLMLIFQIPVLVIVPDFRDEIMAVGTLGYAVFGLINLAFSLLLAAIYPRIRGRVMRITAPDRRMMGATAVLGLLALGGLVVLVVELGGRMVGLID